MNDNDEKILIRTEIKPGDVGYLIYLHGILYSKENNLDHTLEAYVAEPLAGFIKAPKKGERLWIVEKEGEVKGGIAIIRFSETEAQLRWFIVHPDLRGRGIGKRLMKEALTFCRSSGYSSVFLWTIDALTPALNLYTSFGFGKTEEIRGIQWGVMVTEQRYDLDLKNLFIKKISTPTPKTIPER